MKYTYQCPEHGNYLKELSIKERIPPTDMCPECGLTTTRNYRADMPPPPHYNSQGFHKTDYDANGDKLEQLNRNWSKYYNEEPPPPSTKVPKNASEIY